VPMDALVSAATHLTPGWVVQRLVLVGLLVLAGTGAGRLVASYAWPARLAAITFFVWNPWVHERLAIGQWALVAGYACLPWTARAGARFRDDPRAWAPLLGWLVASAVCGPSAGVLAVLLAAGVVAWAGPRPLLTTGVLGLVASLPWLVPSMLLPGGLQPGSAAYESFVPRGESAAGVLPSLVSLGGIWKTSVLPSERTSVVIVVLACCLTVAAALGWRAAARTDERRLVASLAVAGVAALALCALTTVPVIQDGLDSAADHVPAAALFRDSHRLLALFAVALVPGLAAATTTVLRWAVPGREGVRALGALLVLGPVVLLPSLAWGLAGELRPVPWPSDWRAVSQLIGHDDRTVVLPWMGGYRGFAWNDRQASLDPAPRMLPGEVLIDDRVLLRDTMIPSENAFLADVGEALVQPDPAVRLRALGIRWVLVEHGTGPLGELPEGTEAFADGDLTLIDLGEPASYAPGRPPAAVVLGADLVTIAVLAAGLFRYYRRVT